MQELTSTASKHVELALSGRAVQQTIHLTGAQVVAKLGAKSGNCTDRQPFKSPAVRTLGRKSILCLLLS